MAAAQPDDFGPDEDLICPELQCGHEVREHDNWGCSLCECRLVPTEAIAAAKENNP